MSFRGGGGFRGGRDGGGGGRGRGGIDRGGGRGGGGRGGGGFREGRGGGRGGFNRYEDQGPPEEVMVLDNFMQPCEDDAVCKCPNEKIPYFNAPIYLENKQQVGKVDEIFGPIRDYYISVKLSEGVKAKSFNKDTEFYIDPMKLLSLTRFLPGGQTRGGSRGSGRGGRGGGRGGRGGGGGFRGRGVGGGFRGGRGGGGRGGGLGGRFRGGRSGGGFRR